MKQTVITIFFTVTFGSLLLGQENRFFSFELGYDYQNIQMKELNSFLSEKIVKKVESEGLNHGQAFRLGFNFHPLRSFSFGISGNYQMAFQRTYPTFILTDIYGMPECECSGYQQVKVQNSAVGIQLSLLISELLNKRKTEEKSHRFHWGIETIIGIGFSSFTNDFQPPEDPELIRLHEIYYQKSMQGQLGLKAEFDIVKSPLFTSIGLRVGYQYLKTKELKDRDGNEWFIEGNGTLLDFSGIYGGVYLKLGR